MNKDKYVFAQLIEFLDNNKFRHLVDKYEGNRYVKSFTCWNQLMALMFGQLCNRESHSSSIKPAISNIVREYFLSNMPADEKPMLNILDVIGVFLTMTFPSRQSSTQLYLTNIGSLRACFTPPIPIV